MTDLAQKSAVDLVRMLKAKEISSKELVEHYCGTISQRDPALGAFISVDHQRSIEQAKEADRQLAAGQGTAGQATGALTGMPVAVKDVLCTTDFPTTCGSKMLKGYRSPYEATVVAKLRSAGAIIVGKTNMDEFAMGGSTETGHFGVARNPWDQRRTPGGSSGGAASCVAAGMAPLSIGSDTGGSIRQPAAFCGVSGLKPTYGRVSRYGLVAFASSLDQVGPLAHCVEDLALLMDVISGHDPADSTSIPGEATEFLPRLTLDAAQAAGKSLKIGVVKQHLEHPGLDQESRAAIEQAIALFKSHGATIHEVELPHSAYAIATYYIIAPCEASSNLSRFDGAHYGFRASSPSTKSKSDSPLLDMYCRSRGEGFGAEVKRRIMLGTYALSSGYYDAYYLKALKVRRLIRQDYDAAFDKVDILVGPATPTPPFAIGEKVNDPVQMYLEDLYTVGANLAGIPAMSIPCGWNSQGLPIGLHLQARALGELTLLQAGYLYQQATNWKPRIAPQP